jgi:hypothetical protein
VFITLGILIPVLFAFNQGKPIDLPKSAKAENALLEVQEFALIISEPLKLNYKGKSKQFGEENEFMFIGYPNPCCAIMNL